MKQNLIKFLPLIIILSSVIGVLSWYAKNPKSPKVAKPEIVNPSNLESEAAIAKITPTPSSFFFFKQDESEKQPSKESAEPSLVPETSEPDTNQDQDETQGQTRTLATTKTVSCTPVYGMADSCQEHIVVDTGAEENIAYSLSALSYLGGLIAFVKSKND